MCGGLVDRSSATVARRGGGLGGGAGGVGGGLTVQPGGESCSPSTPVAVTTSWSYVASSNESLKPLSLRRSFPKGFQRVPPPE